MSVMKVMEILSMFETQAHKDIERDRKIGADPYESVGRHILVLKIKKRIQREFDPDDKEAA